MKRENIIIIAVLLVIISSSIILTCNTTKNMSRQRISALKKGLFLRYIIESEGNSQIDKAKWYISSEYLLGNYSSLVEENPSFNFILMLYRDYGEFIKDFNKLSEGKINHKVINIDKALKIACEKIYIDIKVLDVKDDLAVINISLIFSDGFALKGKLYDSKISVDSKWLDRGEYYYTEFSKLELSKIISLNLTTYEAYSSSYPHLGEWIFTLKESDLEHRYIPILYSTIDLVDVKYETRVPVTGIAEIILLDKENKAPSSYIINTFNIKPQDQIYTDKGFIPFKKVIEGIPEEYASEFINQFLSNRYTICKSGNYYEEPLLEYNNGTLIVFTGKYYDLMNIENKPWRIIPDIATSEEMILWNAHPELDIRSIEYLNGLEYGGNNYLIMHGNIFLRDVAYTKDGILLYINLRGPSGYTPLTFSLPSIITRTFDISPIYGEITKEEIHIRLVDKGIDPCCQHATSTSATDIDYIACISGSNPDSSLGYSSVAGRVVNPLLCAGPSTMLVKLGCEYYYQTYYGSIDKTYEKNFYGAGHKVYARVDLNLCDGNTSGVMAWLNGACSY